MARNMALNQPRQFKTLWFLRALWPQDSRRGADLWPPMQRPGSPAIFQVFWRDPLSPLTIYTGSSLPSPLSQTHPYNNTLWINSPPDVWAKLAVTHLTSLQSFMMGRCWQKKQVKNVAIGLMTMIVLFVAVTWIIWQTWAAMFTTFASSSSPPSHCKLFPKDF